MVQTNWKNPTPPEIKKEMLSELWQTRGHHPSGCSTRSLSSHIKFRTCFREKERDQLSHGFSDMRHHVFLFLTLLWSTLLLLLEFFFSFSSFLSMSTSLKLPGMFFFSYWVYSKSQRTFFICWSRTDHVRASDKFQFIKWGITCR